MSRLLWSIGLLVEMPEIKRRTLTKTLATCGRPLYGEGKFLKRHLKTFTSLIKLGDPQRKVIAQRVQNRHLPRPRVMQRNLKWLHQISYHRCSTHLIESSSLRLCLRMTFLSHPLQSQRAHQSPRTYSWTVLLLFKTFTRRKVPVKTHLWTTVSFPTLQTDPQTQAVSSRNFWKSIQK